MRPLFLVCGLVMLLAISACDNSNEDPLPPLVPQLQIGDMWVMQLESRLGANFRDQSLEPSITTDTFRVQEIKQINGRDWYGITSRNTGGLFTLFSGFFSYYSFRENGIWQLGQDSSEIHLVRYPGETLDEYEIISGVFSQITNTDTLYTLPDRGTVPAIKFQNRYSTGYKPFELGNSREEFKTLFLEQEVVKNTYFSSEFGVLRKELFYYTVQDPTSVQIAGSLSWDLIAYIPASAQ